MKTVAVGDHGIVRCAITAAGKAVCWRTDSPAYSRFMSSASHSGAWSVASGRSGLDPGAYAYPLDTPPIDKKPTLEHGWVRWCPLAVTSSPGEGGKRHASNNNTVIRVAACGMAVALKTNGEVWVGALDPADQAWHLVSTMSRRQRR